MTTTYLTEPHPMRPGCRLQTITVANGKTELGIGVVLPCDDRVKQLVGRGVERAQRTLQE